MKSFKPGAFKLGLVLLFLSLSPLHSAGAQESSSLRNQISKGCVLKHTETRDKSAPIISSDSIIKVIETSKSIETSNQRCQKQYVLLSSESLQLKKLQLSRKKASFKVKGIKNFSVVAYFRSGEISKFKQVKAQRYKLKCRFHHVGAKLMEFKRCQLK